MSQHDSANLPASAQMQSPGFGPGQHPATTPSAQKQRLNVYTMMLILSFVAICIASTLLYMELNRFGNYPWWNTRDATPATTSYLIDAHEAPDLVFSTNLLKKM